MNQATKVFLVLLRLAIGWHFLFEGLEKWESVHRGPTTTNHPFSSANYLRSSSGPLSSFFRHQAGDLDEAALAHLTVLPAPAGQDLAKVAPHTLIPPALARDWDDYYHRFADHYQLTEVQRKLAEAKLEQREDQVVRWLLTGTKTEEKTYPNVTGKVTIEKTTPERVQDFRAKIQEVRDMETKELPAFGRDVEHEKLLAAKSEVAKMRTSLLDDLDNQTGDTKTALEEVFYQWKEGPLPEVAVNTVALAGTAAGPGPLGALAGLLPRRTKDKTQIAKGPMPPSDLANPVDTIDKVTIWLLLVVGACLLLGLFSRSACVFGVLFLVMVFASMPPLPWIPESLRDEGHYLPLYVNKIVIEMLGLLVLATTHSGRWLGLDGLLQFFNPRRWRSQPAKQTDPRTRRAVQA